MSWSPPLAGEAVGVTVSGRTVRLAADREQPGPARADGHGAGGTPGLLTLPARHMDVPVDRVDAVLTLAAGSPGAAASVDVRGLRARGGWTEWEPGVPTSGPAAARSLRAVLPEPVVDVQARLVLTPPTDAGWAMPGPVVRDLTLTAHVATRTNAAAKRDPRRYRVFATREGLVGGTTANGHVIGERDLFVALPSRRALAPRDSSDYTVKVCAPTGRCAFAPVWDVGPWNTRDDYWNAEKREQWRDLPPGVPQAQAARQDGYNGGKDQFGRTVLNPAGHRPRRRAVLGRARADRQRLGHRRLPRGRATARWPWSASTAGSTCATHRTPAARIVGLAADGAAVPLQCVAGSWLRVGDRPVPAGLGRASPAVAPAPGQAVLASLSGVASVGEWIAGARPRTLPTAVSPVLVGTGAAIGAGRCSRCGHCWRWSSPSPCVVGVNYANDYSDGIRGTDDERVGPDAAGRVAAGRAHGGAQRRVPVLLGRGAGRAHAGVADAAVVARGRRRRVHRGCVVLHRRAPALRLRRARRGGRLHVLRAGRGARDGRDAERHGRARPRSSAPWVSGLLACAVLVVNNLRDIPGDTGRGQADARGRPRRPGHAAALRRVRAAAARPVRAGRDPQLADAARAARAAAGRRR